MEILFNLRIPLIHIGVTLICGLLVWLSVGPREAITLCIGGLISLVILVTVTWTVTQFFSKKAIAWTSVSVVIKYALIGLIFWYATQTAHLSILWLGLGVLLILPTLSVFGILDRLGKG